MITGIPSTSAGQITSSLSMRAMAKDREVPARFVTRQPVSHLAPVYLDILPGRKMGLLTQILPTLFPVILFFSAKTRHIKRLKVQSRLHSGFVEWKAFPIQGLGPKWPG